MNISVITDTSNSWFIPFAHSLVKALAPLGQATFFSDTQQLTGGDIAFFLSCERIVPAATLALHCNNIVVHASALPQGRGWSPLTWQVLEGKNTIPLTLFEASAQVDTGDIYLLEQLELCGNELLPEMRQRMGETIVAMCLTFAHNYPAILAQARPQTGEASSYPRRRPQDSQLNPEQSIAAQFNLLRVVDNNKYPAFFDWRGRRYVVKIEAMS